MSGLLQDFRYALRQLRKSPAFTVVAVATLALGIGANTAVFSVMNAVLLRMLPVRDPHQLYHVQVPNGQPPRASNTGNSDTSLSEPVFEALRQRRDVLDELIAYVPLSFGKVAVRYGNEPEAAEGDEVSGNFFSGLGVQMARGRGFALEDETNHAPVTVISYDYWTRRFARNPAILGETIYVKSVPFTIVGISAPGFRGLEAPASTDFWIPLQNRPELNAWGMPADMNTLYGGQWWCLPLIARLRQNVTPAQAENALAASFGEAAKIGVGSIDPKQWAATLHFDPARGIPGYNVSYRDRVEVLMGLVLLVLLIACSNVGLLLMARNDARQREFSLRMAMGAGRSDLLRRLLAESALLVAAGAGLGWLFAMLSTRALAAWSGIESGLDPDRNVLLFTLGISTVVALAFGIAPLWIALRAPVAGVLRATAHNSTQDRHRTLAGRVVMAMQVAICLVLLVSAGLLLRTLRNYETQDLGLRADGLLVFGVTPQGAHSGAETLAFYRSLLDRLRALPGVESATLMSNRIGTGWSDNNNAYLDGLDLEAKFGSSAIVRSNNVGADYFHVLKVPILQGRDIQDSDTAASQPVAIINETFAKRFLSNTNPLGHKVGNKTVIGVVRDNKYTSVDEAASPMAYYAFAQDVSAGAAMHVEVRTYSDPLGMLPAIRRAVQELNPDVPLETPMLQREQFEQSYAQPKILGRLAAFFGFLAAALVATGLYGTLSYRANRRRTEIGTRMALGAQRRQVLWMVMRESLLIGSLGALVGIPLSLLCAGLMRSTLYQMSPFDPLSFGVAVVSLAGVACLGAFLPALRAANVDPMVALRYE